MTNKIHFKISRSIFLSSKQGLILPDEPDSDNIDESLRNEDYDTFTEEQLSQVLQSNSSIEILRSIRKNTNNNLIRHDPDQFFDYILNVLNSISDQKSNSEDQTFFELAFEGTWCLARLSYKYTCRGDVSLFHQPLSILIIRYQEEPQILRHALLIYQNFIYSLSSSGQIPYDRLNNMQKQDVRKLIEKFLDDSLLYAIVHRFCTTNVSDQHWKYLLEFAAVCSGFHQIVCPKIFLELFQVTESAEVKSRQLKLVSQVISWSGQAISFPLLNFLGKFWMEFKDSKLKTRQILQTALKCTQILTNKINIRSTVELFGENLNQFMDEITMYRLDKTELSLALEVVCNLYGFNQNLGFFVPFAVNCLQSACENVVVQATRLVYAYMEDDKFEMSHELGVIIVNSQVNVLQKYYEIVWDCVKFDERLMEVVEGTPYREDYLQWSRGRQ